ncbi:TetR/AcrR family transcriptional regulator [Mycolicibacterium mengxianglii]|uniref:TetR/AcrR family transcriptional regulator n=1 Tax=Mycolicibacterium mengxianglii TaxID=2736649 RepID=UPI0018D1DBE1|nr:TetR/AcrR family transcriptional regulator [Mycolicibacterium mengxianglii]
MGTAVSREAYFATGVDVLADVGYGGLKLAEVCTRLGVTTGSFYHYFSNWAEYTHQLVEHWLTAVALDRFADLAAEPDPHRRIELMIDLGLGLHHDACAAVRAWSSVDPRIRTAVVKLDHLRYDMVYASALEILGDERRADVFAKWALFMLVGYEQCALPRDQDAFASLTKEHVRRALQGDNMASVPD